MKSSRVFTHMLSSASFIASMCLVSTPSVAQSNPEWEDARAAGQGNVQVGGIVIEEAKMQRAVAFGAMGMGVAVATSGAVYGLTAVSLADRGGSTSTVRSRAFVANVLMGSGATMALGGATMLFIVRLHEKQKAPASPTFDSSDEIDASRRVRDLFVLPTVSRDGMGVGAGFRF